MATHKFHCPLCRESRPIYPRQFRLYEQDSAALVKCTDCNVPAQVVDNTGKLLLATVTVGRVKRAALAKKVTVAA